MTSFHNNIKITNKHIIGLSKFKHTLNTLKDGDIVNQTQKTSLSTPSLPCKNHAPHVFPTFAPLKIYTWSKTNWHEQTWKSIMFSHCKDFPMLCIAKIQQICICQLLLKGVTIIYTYCSKTLTLDTNCNVEFFWITRLI